MIVGALLLLAFGLLCLGCLALLAGSICMPRNKRVGKSLLAAGAGMCALPLACFFFLRLVNPSYEPGNYVDTGRYVEERDEIYGFTVEGVRYRRLDSRMDCGLERWELGEEEAPVFTWDTPPRGLMDGFFRLFFGFRDQGNYYAVHNGTGVELVQSYGVLFCPEEETAKVQQWYGDTANYDWYVCDWHHGEEQVKMLEPQLDTAAAQALADWEEAVSREESQLALEDEAWAGGEGLLEGSGLGAVLVSIPKGRDPFDSIVLEQQSRDGIAVRTSLPLTFYQDRFWRRSYQRDVGEEYLCRFYPLPQELEPYFSSLTGTEKGSEAP